MIKILLIMFCAAGPVFAGPDRIALHLGSHHAGATTEFEEVNPGVFLSWDRPKNVTFSVGAFRNSYGRGSIAATAAKTFYRGENTAAAIFAGLAHYPGNGNNFSHAVGDFVPLAGLQFHYRNVFVNVMPGDGEVADGIFSFGITLPLHNQ